MKFTKRGVEFNHTNGDTLLALWPWNAERTKSSKLFSILHQKYFLNLSTYYTYLTTLEEVCQKVKVIGYDADSILMEWVRIVHPNQFLVILQELNLGAKPSDFWRKMPILHRIQFNKDYVILFCKTESEMLSLVDSVDNSFGKAYGFKYGKFVSWNGDSHTCA